MDTQKRIIMWVAVVLVLGVTGVAMWQTATNPTLTEKKRVEIDTLSESTSARDHTKGATATSSVSLV